MATRRTHLTRRDVLMGSAALTSSAAMLVLGQASHLHHVVAQEAAPTVSPVADADYAHPEMLVDAAWVREHLDDPALVLVGFMPAEAFATGHIPGSVQLDWPALEVIDTSDASIARWRDRAIETLTARGITGDRTVVAYDAGTLFAARLWWILHYLGHEEKHVLNGGLAAWQQVTGEVATGEAPTAVEASPGVDQVEHRPRADVLAQLDDVRANLDDPEVAIIDARTPDEYTDGHIPGAVNINYPRNALAEEPKFWKSADQLRAMYEAVGITQDKHVIPYCATGVRSAVIWFTLRLIGYEDIALYTGSWKEWGNHPDTRKAEGEAP